MYIGISANYRLQYLRICRILNSLGRHRQILLKRNFARLIGQTDSDFGIDWVLADYFRVDLDFAGCFLVDVVLVDCYLVDLVLVDYFLVDMDLVGFLRDEWVLVHEYKEHVEEMIFF